MSSHNYSPRERRYPHGGSQYTKTPSSRQEETVTQRSDVSEANTKLVAYTPTTEEVRGYYDPSTAERFKEFFSNSMRRDEDYAQLSEDINAEFDRWLAKVQSDAWLEGARHVWNLTTDAYNGEEYEFGEDDGPVGQQNPYENNVVEEKK